MTVEQALVYLLAAVAGIFLFFGLAQALEGRHGLPRRTRARSPETNASSERDGNGAGPLRGAVTPAAGGAVALGADLVTDAHSSSNGTATPLRADDSVRHRHAVRSARREAPSGASLEPSATVLGAPTVSALPPDPASHTPGVAPSPELLDSEVALVEQAVRLCLARDHDELLRVVPPRLEADARAQRGLSPHAASALWCLVGLARPVDADARRTAFAASLTALASATPSACPPGLAAVAMPVARRLLELVPGDGAPPPKHATPEDRLGAARLAVMWLTWRLHIAPDDGEALATLVAARDALADVHAERVTAAIERQEYGVARGLVQRAIDAAELTELRGAVLLDLLGAEFRREVDRLTAAAIRGDHDEEPAVAGLGRAEALLGAMPDGAIGPTHRAAVAQRIWRGHSKLGFRRLRLGQLDGAADALFHALAMRDIGRRRQRQVRDALVRALEGLGDQRVAAVETLVAEGKQPAAADEVARLERRIERARGEGVSEEELEVASSKLARLQRQLASGAE